MLSSVTFHDIVSFSLNLENVLKWLSSNFNFVKDRDSIVFKINYDILYLCRKHGLTISFIIQYLSLYNGYLV